ncbi:protein PRRC2C-like isoform X4 [Macrobrachium rosenbergii]|uniref:protein PRRC2C-like isoform X4 n=1 Tax=Macrobrachium rosenbergii TaxID=79674 RepID=UPI0034D599DE
MSASSGPQGKGEKSKKFQSLNINNIFKGKSIETTQKTVIQKHGMQSLGKVASVRRMPPPANLPSLKAENSGNDPNVNLVPAGGQGWGSKVEEMTPGGSSTPQEVMVTPSPTPPLDITPKAPGAGGPMSVDVGGQASTKNIVASSNNNSTSSTPNSQPAVGGGGVVDNGSGGTLLNTPLAANSSGNIITTTSVNNNVAANTNNNNTIPGSIPSNAAPNATLGSAVANTGNKNANNLPANLNSTPNLSTSAMNSSNNNNNNNVSGNSLSSSSSSNSNSKPWSNAAAGGGGAPTSGSPGAPLPLDGGPPQSSSAQQSPFFHREFPKLGGGNSVAESSPQYGPGPSLRPQTEGSWIQGGGRGVALPQDERLSSPQNTTTFNGEVHPPNRNGGMGTRGTPPGGPPILPGGPIGPLAPPAPPAGASPHQFRGVVPPYMMRGNFPGGFAPPNYPGHGHPRPPYVRDQRNRGGPGPSPSSGGNSAPDDDVVMPPPIIKKEALEGFEDAPFVAEGWATSAGEVDYNQKLNFSEDEGTAEEESTKIRSLDRKSDRRERWEKDSNRHSMRDCEERRDEHQVSRDRDRDREAALREKDPQGPRERDSRRSDGDERNRDRDRGERRFSPGESGRWQQPQQPQQRGSYDYRGGPVREYGGGQGSGMRVQPTPQHPSQMQPHSSMHNSSHAPPVHSPSLNSVHPPPPHSTSHGPPHSRDEDDLWREKRPVDDVQVVIERARQLHEEEEKRYEEKKRYEQNKAGGGVGKKGSRDPRDARSDFVMDERDREDAADPIIQRSRGNSESRDEKPPSRDGGGRDYRPYQDRRDSNRDNYRDSYRDHPREQYDRSYDRRDGPRDQQPVFSSQFKSKLPPRFQKQQEMMRSGGGGGSVSGGGQPPFRPGRAQTPPSFEPRFGASSGNRFMGRDSEVGGKDRRLRTDSDTSGEVDERPASLPSAERHRDDRDDRLDRSDQRDFRYERQERSEPPSRADRQERPERADRHDNRPERSDRPERIDRPDRSERPDRSDRIDRQDRPDRNDRLERTDRQERLDRPERLDRNDRLERSDRMDSRRDDFYERERDGYRGRSSQGSYRDRDSWGRSSYYEKYDERNSHDQREYDYDRRRNVNGEDWDSRGRGEFEREGSKNRRIDNRKNFDDPRSERGDNFLERREGKIDSWARSPYESEPLGKESNDYEQNDLRMTHKEWDKEVEATEKLMELCDEPRDRPQRPDSRDSRTSRDSRASKDSFERCSSLSTSREKKMEITSWADATYEYDDYYRSENNSNRDEFARDSTYQESPKKGDCKEERPSSKGSAEKELSPKENAMTSEEKEAQETLKEASRSTHAPAPITRERLEASDKEKEIRKNMTTLKKSVQGEIVKKPEVKEVVHSKEQRDNVWSSRSKNAERSRPDSSGTGTAASNAGSSLTKAVESNIWGAAKTTPTNSESTTPITAATTTAAVSQVSSSSSNTTTTANTNSNSSTNSSSTTTTHTNTTTPIEAMPGRVPTPQGIGSKPTNPPQPQIQSQQQQPQQQPMQQTVQQQQQQLPQQLPHQQQQKPPQASPPPPPSPNPQSEQQQLARTTSDTTTPTTTTATATTLAPGSSPTVTAGGETVEGVGSSGGGGGDVAERESAERGGGSKSLSSGSRASRGNRSESSRSGGRGGSRGSTYPVYRGGRGTRGTEYTRRSRGPPPRFQKRSYRDGDYYYYEEYHPRMHRERKDDRTASCDGDWSSTNMPSEKGSGGGSSGGGAGTVNFGSGSSLSNSREESGDGVVIVDDQPQVSELISDILDANDGFKEVTKRKTGKEKNKGPLDEPCGTITSVTAEPVSAGVATNVGSPAPTAASKKQSKEKKSRPSKSGGFERSRQSKLPPRLAKQRENNRINAMKSSAAAGSSSPVESPTNTLFPVKDSTSGGGSIPPPPKNAWDKPLTAALRANSPSQATITLDGTTPSAAKPVSFDNHDSGVEISDQPNSGGSSQRSSPSDDPTTTNFAKVDKSTLDGTSVPSQTIIIENTNFKAAGIVNATVGAEYKAKFGDAPKPQRQRENRDRKSVSPDSTLSLKEEKEKSEKAEPIELPLSFPTKVEESGADMKLDFTFDSGLAEVPGSVTTKGISLPRSLVMTTGSMQSPISPSTDDLNLKIASVKKVWETMAPVPEHAEDVTSSVAFSSPSLSAVDSVAGLDHSPALEASFTPKDSPVVVGSCEDPTQDVGGGYQGGSPLQQGAAMASAMVYTSAAAAYTSNAGASLTKAEVSRSGNVCKVKPQQQATSNSVSPGPGGSSLGITGSLSPPLASGSAGPSSSMYQTLGSTAPFGGIGGAIPSPPMMFNSNQQLPQTGLYQPFLEGTPVLGQRGASQFSQYPPYGLGQGLSSNAFGQQSMFLQTPPPLTTPDLYTNNLSQYRLQPTAGVTGFGQSQPQNQNTVLISSASNSLMSSAVKPSSQTFGNSQQNFGTIGSKAGTPFQQSGLGTALQGGPQPSQLYIYDPSQPMGLLGSQLVQRPGVQNSVIQAIQPPSSFYSNNGAAGAPGAPPPTAPPTGPGGPQQASVAAAAAGFYTASGSPLQAAVQQQAQPPLQTPPAAYSLQGFGNQSQGPAGVGMQGFGSSMSLAAQQIGAQAFRGGPALQASFLKSLQPGANIQDTATRQQLKSPGAAQNSFTSAFFPPSSGISSVNSSGNSSCNTNSSSNHSGSGIPQISSPKTQNRKMTTQSGLSHQSSNRNASYPTQNASQMMSGSLRSSGMVMGLRGQLPMGSQSGGLGGPAAGMGGTSSRFSNPGPIQRPPASQGPGANSSHRSGRGQSQGQQQQQQQQQTQQRSSNPPSSAQQAKLRADALSTTQAFFNRDANKPEKKIEDKPSDSITSKDDMSSDKVSATPATVADGPPK